MYGTASDPVARVEARHTGQAVVADQVFPGQDPSITDLTQLSENQANEILARSKNILNQVCGPLPEMTKGEDGSNTSLGRSIEAMRQTQLILDQITKALYELG